MFHITNWSQTWVLTGQRITLANPLIIKNSNIAYIFLFISGRSGQSEGFVP